MMWFRYLPVIFVLVESGSTENKKPHIIVIIADDMGFNDVGFHGSNQIPTPNIDALAYNGVILNSHYTQELCTPSRSAFLTGKYPIHLGMQHLVILEPEPWGLPLNETLIPQHLKNNGYSTHAIGKWHLGFFEKEYTPTYRGFDTHYGYWQGLQDYYSHMTHATFTSEYGYDMRRGMNVDHSAKGKYSTTLFTEEAVRLIREHDTKNPMFMYMAHLAPHTGNDNDPLQAPDEEIAKFAHIEDPERRIYAGLNKSEISNIDGMDMWETISEGAESPRTELIYNIDDVGPQYGALRRGEWKYIYGSTTNGKKDVWFDNPGDNNVYHYDKNLILNSKAGNAFAGVITYQQIKEKSMKQIDRNFSTELLDENTIDKLRNEATIKCNAVNAEDQLEENKCDLLKSPCLFNIKDDPCERVNLASRRPNIVANLEQAIVQYRKTALPPRNLPRDLNADPDRWGGVWTNWHDCENVFKRKLPLDTLSPLAITMISLAGIAVLAIVIGLLFLSYCRVKRKRTSPPTLNGHFDDRPLNEANAC